MQNVEIWKEKGMYAARIPSLHINTQAKTIRELKKNLKEAIEVTVEGLVEMRKNKIAVKASA